MLEALGEFLRRSPDWEAEVVGSGLPHRSHLDRCHFFPAEPPSLLAQRFRTSKILLFSSRYESFLMTGAEALTAGCSVVGPAASVSSSYFASFVTDPPASDKAMSLANSLLAEKQAWTMGRRTPAEISSLAIQEFSPRAVARRFLPLGPLP
ncbi:glycosyltransferase family 1 protein [bacterium]|nr:glycosyltransferase family 1 protein [bacterium]